MPCACLFHAVTGFIAAASSAGRGRCFFVPARLRETRKGYVSQYFRLRLKSTAKGFFPDSNRKKKVYEPFSAPAKPLSLSGVPACQLPETEKAQNRSNARKRSPRQELALFSGWGESNPARFPPFPLRLHRSDIYLHDFICLRFSQRINHGLDFS